MAHVVTSDTSRAVQTGEIAAGLLGATVTAVKALREVFLGDLLGSAFHVEHIDAVAHRWHDGDLDARFPGGESGHDVVERHRRTLDELGRSHPGATVLVVAHQTALGIALPSIADGSGTGVDASWTRNHPLPNAGAAVLEGIPGAWRITRWGDPPAPEA